MYRASASGMQKLEALDVEYEDGDEYEAKMEC
jgi:hypothetical protein